MSKASFPEAYTGSGRQYSRLVGRERWDEERAHSITSHEKYLMDCKEAGRDERQIAYQALAVNQHQLGLLYAWEGRANAARQLMADCAATTCEYLQRRWPSNSPANYSGIAIEGALAAALANQPDSAHMLFTYAARFSPV